MTRDHLKDTLRQALAVPVARVLARLGVTPNLATLLGLAITLAAAYLVSQGWFLPGGLVLLFSGAFDALDGTLARLTGKASDAGALLDSVTDRLAEAALLLGLAWYFLSQEPAHALGVLLAFGAFVGSVLVSYVRARGEGLGIECKVGLFARTERVVVLGIGLAAGFPIPTLGVVMVGSLLTAAHRFWHTFRRARKP